MKELNVIAKVGYEKKSTLLHKNNFIMLLCFCKACQSAFMFVGFIWDKNILAPSVEGQRFSALIQPYLLLYKPISGSWAYK